MKATIIPLGSANDGHYDSAYSLVFVPGPAFVRGQEVLVNHAPRGPAYEVGYLDAMLKEGHVPTPREPGGARCLVVVHAAGHGTNADIEAFLTDLRRLGFAPLVVSDRG